MLLSLHSLYLIITVMTLGLKSHDLYGVPNEINDDDDDDGHATTRTFEAIVKECGISSQVPMNVNS